MLVHCRSSLSGGFDLTTFHTCLSPWERKTTLVRIRAVNKIHPGGRRRHSAARSSPPPEPFRNPIAGRVADDSDIMTLAHPFVFDADHSSAVRRRPH